MLNTLFKKGASTVLSKSIKPKLTSWKPTTNFSTSRISTLRGSNLLYGGLALLFGVGGASFAAATSLDKSYEQSLSRGVDSYLSKEEAKKLLPQAIELDETGRNREAAILYRVIHRAYGRAAKASGRKRILLARRIGILKALEGKHELALIYLLEGFERSAGLDPTSDSHFEQYFDLSLVQYKFEDYSTSNEMFERCLEMAEYAYADKNELMAALHQYLGFGYYKKGAIKKSEKHLTEALRYLNTVKKQNKAFLYFSCKEFLEFYVTVGDFKKALLFLEQAKVLLNQENFFTKETKEKGMDIHSAYAKKYIQDLNENTENWKLGEMAYSLYNELGEYRDEAQKKNLPFNKLSKEEKNSDIHGLLRW